MTVFRRMTKGELAGVLDWAAAEGWNPGIDDADAFMAADPGGFFVAEDAGAPVAAISVVNHGPDFAFLGLYLCRPSHRGRGIGHALWRHAIGHAGNRTIGLDGVPDQQENYVKSGFSPAGATTRYSGAVQPSNGADIRPATARDIPAMLSLEADASGWAKPTFLTSWFTHGDHRTSQVLERSGRIEGLVSVRKCRSGAKIGPLVANDEAAALGLIRHAALPFGGALSIDVPAASAPLDGLCRSIGLTPGFQTARMYRGTARTPRADWYAVGTLELG